jgi:hypothetical protein
MTTNTLTPMIGTTLSDEELSAFHGGSCRVGMKEVAGELIVTTEGECSNVKVKIVVHTQK